MFIVGDKVQALGATPSETVSVVVGVVGEHLVLIENPTGPRTCVNVQALQEAMV